MAGFQKGHEKMGGRAKGVRNKNTEMKDNLRNFMLENFEAFQASFRKITIPFRAAVLRTAARSARRSVTALSRIGRWEKTTGSDA